MKLSPQSTMKIKAVISSILIISFLIVSITGIGLLLQNMGKIDTFLFGFERAKLLKVHTLRGAVMAGTVIIHLFFNFKMFLMEVKMLFKRK